MECISHCSNSVENLSKLDSLSSWKTLVNAARIRIFEPILSILEEVEPDTVPDIWYHRKCRSIFTMKRPWSVLKTKKNQVLPNVQVVSLNQ